MILRHGFTPPNMLGETCPPGGPTLPPWLRVPNCPQGLDSEWCRKVGINALGVCCAGVAGTAIAGQSQSHSSSEQTVQQPQLICAYVCVKYLHTYTR